MSSLWQARKLSYQTCKIHTFDGYVNNSEKIDKINKLHGRFSNLPNVRKKETLLYLCYVKQHLLLIKVTREPVLLKI